MFSKTTPPNLEDRARVLGGSGRFWEVLGGSGRFWEVLVRSCKDETKLPEPPGCLEHSSVGHWHVFGTHFLTKVTVNSATSVNSDMLQLTYPLVMSK